MFDQFPMPRLYILIPTVWNGVDIYGKACSGWWMGFSEPVRMFSFSRHLIRFPASIIKVGKSDYSAHRLDFLFWLELTGLNGLLGSRLRGAAPYCLCWHLHHAWVARVKTRPRTCVTCGLPRMCVSSERARCQCQAHGASLPCYSGLTGRNFNEVVGLQCKYGADSKAARQEARKERGDEFRFDKNLRSDHLPSCIL